MTEPSVATTGYAGSPLKQELDGAVLHERRRAMRALLMRPLLTAADDDAEVFGLVRRHAAWLSDWLDRNPGWSLHVDGELARLRKTPGDLHDDTRPAVDPANEMPFTRRRYVLLCLALAALNRGERQTALGALATEIGNLLAADPELADAGVTLDLATRDARTDLVHVIRLLLDRHVLVRVQGDEQAYLTSRGDVLYNVRRAALTAMLNVKRGPSTITATSLDERIEKIVEEILPATEDAANRRLRCQLTRKLLDDPVLYYDALTDDERAYLTSQRSMLFRQIEEATGLLAEIRRDGVAGVDVDGDLTDLGLPETGTEGHLTLLLAEHLAEHARETPGVAIGLAMLEAHTRSLVEQNLKWWRKDASQPGAEITLTRETLDRLESLRLVRLDAGGVVPLPAIARYALGSPVTDSESPR